MVVQHNISAMTANRYYGINNKGLASSLEKLASGYAINKAGDNAAGLAVSEKMRAQIGGLTQASKNAEDGISLVQTMEGALQETDSILQRMRTLAVQSANGSYQDDVDREAMQLEFDQLNDELNQIADTDFNGVVMLNGGQMADGLKAVDGKFDYSASNRVAKQLSASEINTLDNQGMDNVNANTASLSHADGTTATAASSATAADTLWYDLGFDRNDATQGNNGPDSIDVTFTYSADTQTWTATGATGGVSADNLKNLKVNTTGNNGGFQVGSASSYATPDESANLVNVVVDSNNLVDGDSIVVRFNNPQVKNTAIENIGVSSKTVNLSKTGTEGDAPTADSDLKVEVTNTTIETTNDPSATDPMTADIKALFDTLDGAELKITYADATAAKGALLAGTQTATISWKNANGGTESIVLDASNKKKDWTIGGTTFLVDGETTDGKITIGTKSSAGAIDKSLVEFTVAKQAANADGNGKGSAGTVTYKLATDTSNFSSATKPSAEVINPDAVVSKSNAFDQSKATMTYTDHLGLQVGARTKDLVDFTFSYKSNGLGDLKSNLNCSSRTDGLGTADLSIADQKSANAAIDKIDNAINKVNMVRATFGAAQNRIEHKINNIDTNTENITAAESRIRDTQMDKEMMKFTSAQILSQASQSMLAQANSLPQGVLQLLG